MVNKSIETDPLSNDQVLFDKNLDPKVIDKRAGCLSVMALFFSVICPFTLIVFPLPWAIVIGSSLTIVPVGIALVLAVKGIAIAKKQNLEKMRKSLYATVILLVLALLFTIFCIGMVLPARWYAYQDTLNVAMKVQERIKIRNHESKIEESSERNRN